MPNQGNKSNGKSGVVQPQKNSTTPSTQKRGTASATKHSRGDNGQSAAEALAKEEAKRYPAAAETIDGEKAALNIATGAANKVCGTRTIENVKSKSGWYGQTVAGQTIGRAQLVF